MYAEGKAMSRVQQVLGLTIIFVLALGLAYAGWRMGRPAGAATCQACGRVIHDHMRTIAFVGDKREVFCGPTCALSTGAQMHRPVHFERLADYLTGRKLRPADAFAVEGSNVIPCVRSHQMLNRDGQAVPMDFDRCLPSIIAFANRASAEKFASEHGGRVDTFLHMIVARRTVSSLR
jgi:NosL